jgi:DNA end-binding protein Ku
MAEQLMKTMATEWDPTEYTDTYRRDVLKLIKARAKGGGKKTRTEAPEEEPETKVLDLMAALKRSVESKGKSKAPRRSAARKKTAARRSA